MNKLTWEEEHLAFANLNVLELASLDFVGFQSFRRGVAVGRASSLVQDLERHASLDLEEPLLGLVDMVILGRRGRR
jgi:hypothetical protein